MPINCSFSMLMMRRRGGADPQSLRVRRLDCRIDLHFVQTLEVRLVQQVVQLPQKSPVSLCMTATMLNTLGQGVAVGIEHSIPLIKSPAEGVDLLVDHPTQRLGHLPDLAVHPAKVFRVRLDRIDEILAPHRDEPVVGQVQLGESGRRAQVSRSLNLFPVGL